MGPEIDLMRGQPLHAPSAGSIYLAMRTPLPPLNVLTYSIAHRVVLQPCTSWIAITRPREDCNWLHLARYSAYRSARRVGRSRTVRYRDSSVREDRLHVFSSEPRTLRCMLLAC